MTVVFVCYDGHVLTRRHTDDDRVEWVGEDGTVFISTLSDGWPIHAGGPEGGQRIAGRVECRPNSPPTKGRHEEGQASDAAGGSGR